MSGDKIRREGFFQRINTDRSLFLIYAIMIIVVTLHRYYPHHFVNNNYRIFKYSFDNLIHHKDLYIYHPDLYGDLYKYSPGFSVLMFPFYYMPDLMGLILWNLLNGMLLFFAIKRLPLSPAQLRVVLWIIIPELIISLQNAQTNGLTAALILMTFVSLKNGKPIAGALSTALVTAIKIFGGICGLFFVFFKRKTSYIFWTIAFSVLLQALPLLFISPAELMDQYASWFSMLKADHADPVGLSAMHLFSALSSRPIDFYPVQIAGLLLTLLPLVHIKKYHDFQFQLFFAASLMLAMVLFNHKAESPTFIIAVTGVAIWYCISPKGLLEKALLVFTILFTSLSPSELVPPVLKEEFFVKYSLKALPCFLVWCVLQWELHTKRLTEERTVKKALT
jgi:hypothetical protein